VRLIAATNRKLDDEVHAGRFRSDLWYRLNVFPITVPPLRQRPEDIPLLVNHFVEKHCRNLARPILPVSKATMKLLQARDWPGNVRELENVIERAVISSRGGMLEIGEALPQPAPRRAQEPVVSAGRRTLVELERDHIVATLERLRWKVEGDGGAAEILGINPSTLRTRMRKHGISRPRA
jgi:chemotaxis protein methyltransferase CheR